MADIQKDIDTYGKPMVDKVIEIIEYLKPKYYFLENPRYSAIWKYVEDKEFLKKYVDVDYCRFGYDYKKSTKFLTNKKLEDCKCMCKGKHKITIGHICKTYLTLLQKYSYPPKLITYLLS